MSESGAPGDLVPSVVLTGGTGYLGGRLTAALLARGTRVASVVRSESSPLPDGVQRIIWTGDAAALRDEIAAFQPSIGMHLASVSSGDHTVEQIDPMIDASFRLGVHLLDALAEAGSAGLVVADSFWQHSGARGQVVASNLYAAIKSALDPVAAFYASARGVTTVSLELFDVYGPNDPRGRLLDTLLRLDPEQSVSASPGMQVVDFVYVDDVVTAFIAAAGAVLDGQLTGTPRYAITGGERRTLREIVPLVAEIRGVQLDVRWGALPYRQSDVLEPCTNCRTLPGWSPSRTLADGIRSLVAAGVR